MFIYQKTIDRSALREGFQLPVECHDILNSLPGGIPQKGVPRKLKIVLDGETYLVDYRNQPFNSKFDGHADVVQLRYTPKSPFAVKLREVFVSTLNYVDDQKNLPENKDRKVTIKVPSDIQEYMILSSTDFPDVFLAECITAKDKYEISTEISKYSELDFETFEGINDPSASIKIATRVQKIRHLDRSIGDSLKKLYDFRCQMTGEKVGEIQGGLVVEAHHIIPFTESMNNDSSNIIILSPNYHRIVHKAKPQFDRKKLSFCFPNGLIEKVMIDKHLSNASSKSK